MMQKDQMLTSASNTFLDELNELTVQDKGGDIVYCGSFALVSYGLKQRKVGFFEKPRIDHQKNEYVFFLMG